MKVPASISCVPVLVCACLIALYPPQAAARSAVSAGSLVEWKLNGETILSASREKLATAVRDCVEGNPGMAGKIVQAVLGGGRADADALAPQVIVAAIEGLGGKSQPAAVGDIVYFAVKATPAVVLDIVRTAVKASPGSAKAIVRAAVIAMPDPTARVGTVTGKIGRPGFDKDAKEMPEPDTTGNDTLPIGEAIADAAHQADPSVSLQDMLDTAHQAARGSGDGFTTVSTYPGYYYPPLTSAVKAIPTPGAPVLPVVSQ
jgi:hypothetical protein